MSPKEYLYINNTNINKRTYSKVHTHLKNGIYKKRLFETHDNLIGIKPLEEIVEEGIYKALKDIVTNRIIETGNTRGKIDIDKITIKIKNNFPYGEIPENLKEGRKFYVDTITDMIIDELF